MKQTIFRDLRPDEIEVRVGNIVKDKNGNPKGFQLLLYKTSRTDMAILDETFGTFGWRNHFYQVKNTMVCSIEIWDEEKQMWINKDNGGDDDTAMEQVKSELSDSIKRAGSTLGIGRKLYTASKIYMVVDITENNTTKSYFQVKDIDYNEKEITKLVIINKKTKEEVISYGMGKSTTQAPKVSQNAQNQGYNHSPKATPSDISKDFDKNMKKVRAFAESLPADKFTPFFNWLEKKYNTRIITQLTADQLIEVINLYKIKDIEE